MNQPKGMDGHADGGKGRWGGWGDGGGRGEEKTRGEGQVRGTPELVGLGKQGTLTGAGQPVPDLHRKVVIEYPRCHQ